MADNVRLNQGAGGQEIASTDIGGVQFQRVRTLHEDISANIWSAQHVPAANTRATITRGAQAAGIRNVCTWLTIKLVAGATAPTAVNTSFSLIDGASGGTTYLWRATISLPATAGADNGIALSNLWIPGTAATGMTLEALAAGGANTIESVSMGGTVISE